MKHLGKTAFVVFLALLSASRLRAEAFTPTEYQVKAAFLYNFGKFVEWPPEQVQTSTGTFSLCILGDDPFGKDLDDQVAGKTVQDKNLVVKRMTSAGDVAGCQLVFISASEEQRLDMILKRLEGTPILTVSDMQRFVEEGGMVGFSLENSKVRFSINLPAAEKVGLKISSQLLKLAKAVKGKPTLPTE